MISKSYGYMIFIGENDWSVALKEEAAIKCIQDKLFETPHYKKIVKEAIIDEGYPKTIFSDEFMKDFIHDQLKNDSYYFADDGIYYVQVPLIEN